MKRLLCALFLRLYPKSFRDEYGREWRELAARRGFLSLVGDTLREVPVQWRHRASGGQATGRKGGGSLGTTLQDARFGLRTLRKRPLFTLMAVGTLSLGIGSATAMFSVVEGVLLRGLPFENPEELVSVWQTYPEWRGNPDLAPMWDWGYLAYPGFERWRDGQTQLQGVAVHASTARNLTSPGDVERITVGVASASLFSVLGVQPVLGRGFLPEEDQAGTAPVAVLSHAFWQERFGGDEGVLRSTIGLNQTHFEVVGILPRHFELRGLGFFGSGGAKPVWIPTGADGYRRAENSHSYEAVGRLKPGVTLPQVAGEARSLIPAPDEDPGHSVRAESWIELQRAGLWSPLLLLLGASGILLLIAAGNVATLLLGEAAGRRHEMATRTALGAGRRRLVRQLLTESILLGMGGSLLGIGVAIAGTHFLLAMAPALPRLDQVSVNGSVLFFAVGLGVLSSLVFGLAPALHLAGSGARQTLATGWRSGPRGGNSLQKGLIAAELALTMVLLVSGVLVVRSLDRLLAVETGFQAEQLVMARVNLPGYRFGGMTERALRVEEIQETLSALPGVTAASGTSSLPFYNNPNALSYGIEGRPAPEGTAPHASVMDVLPGFFETMGIRIMEGRPIQDSDRSDGQPVAVISETFARRHWPDESPLGARILFGDTLLVVGVAADVIHESLESKPSAILYLPFFRSAGPSINFLVRTTGAPEALYGMIREAIHSVDREIPITRTGTVTSLVLASARDARFRALLLAVFAACASLLACAGVFGVTSRAVAQRQKELGVRKALGAGAGGLVRLSLLGAAGPGVVGVASGLVITLFTSGFLRGFLFEVQPWDPATYGLVAGVLMAIVFLAALFPARKAGRVEPMEVLREE